MSIAITINELQIDEAIKEYVAKRYARQVQGLTVDMVGIRKYDTRGEPNGGEHYTATVWYKETEGGKERG